MNYMWIFGIVLVTLRLVGAITWAWAWVLAPFWGWAIIAFAAVVYTAVTSKE